MSETNKDTASDANHPSTPHIDAGKLGEVKLHLPGLARRIAGQLDEPTRRDLREFLVALACCNDIEETGTWLFVLMRALESGPKRKRGRS
jgi:hypothetical protein